MRYLQAVATAVALLGLFSLTAHATHRDENPGIHKVVIQVSSDDERTQTIAMNNALNLQKELGIDNVMIEIVAYGPGLSMLLSSAKQATRVSSLAKQEITFSACGNTIRAVEKREGKPLVLSEGVRVVPAGVLRIMELQEQGFSYVRP